ncbi:hypothetical protein [Parabacteroides sp. FAFU027]|uniref:NigD1/NigD2 family lipoprotein n=1 Tax=Parabacteroides sp. FAFU027 TaxID=2922715 RepID=UPI001FAF575D|nr:NigD-like C-terminal domain-containing protein [Parabacteroides sp. FAFU027]
MRTRGILFVVIGFFAVLVSCKKEDIDYGLGDFRLDLATIEDSSNIRFFRLDNLDKLLPQTSVASKYTTGSRVLLNYNIEEKIGASSFSINTNSVSSINTATIKPLTSNLSDDPLYIESVWQSGDWLNFRLGFEYNNKQHGISLFYYTKAANDTLYLELRHSKNGDADGYMVNTFASYNLTSFSKIGKSTPLKVKVNTSDKGVKYYRFEYLSPTQD